jgi:hypothetical protein
MRKLQLEWEIVITVMTEETDMKPRNVDIFQTLEEIRKHPWKAPEGTQSCKHLDLRLWTSTIVKEINVCFVPLNLWQSDKNGKLHTYILLAVTSIKDIVIPPYLWMIQDPQWMSETRESMKPDTMLSPVHTYDEVKLVRLGTVRLPTANNKIEQL